MLALRFTKSSTQSEEGHFAKVKLARHVVTGGEVPIKDGEKGGQVLSVGLMVLQVLPLCGISHVHQALASQLVTEATQCGIVFPEHSHEDDLRGPPAPYAHSAKA